MTDADKSPAATTPSTGPVLVLDNNVLRDESIIERCFARYRQTGEQIALPEMAMFELTKHPDKWEHTVRRSLACLSRCPEALVITHAAKALGQDEEATGNPTSGVVNERMTTAWRRLLHDLREGDGPDLDYFKWAVANLRKELRYEEYETDTLALIQSLTSSARSSFPADVLAPVGRDLERDDRGSFRGLLIGVMRIEHQRDAHVRRGVAKAVADGLLVAPAVSYLFAFAVGAIALEWTVRGGIESANPRRVANDVLDIEYGMAALWIGRLVAKDAGARQRFEDLKVLGAATWPNHREWFQRAEAVSPAAL